MYIHSYDNHANHDNHDNPDISHLGQIAINGDETCTFDAFTTHMQWKHDTSNPNNPNNHNNPYSSEQLLFHVFLFNFRHSFFTNLQVNWHLSCEEYSYNIHTYHNLINLYIK